MERGDKRMSLYMAKGVVETFMKVQTVSWEVTLARQAARGRK